jgi:TonB family protein
LRKVDQGGGGFETIQFGVVAKCGSSERVLHLPPITDFDKLRATAPPRIVGLWELATDIIVRAFGKEEIFQGITPQQDWELQLTGKALEPELMSGRYDRGWARWNGGFPKLLTEYQGPMRKSVPLFTPHLENAGALKLAEYADPVYPRLAMLARVEGRVELRLSVDPDTGNIGKVDVVSGNQMLRASATEAAKKWKLVSGPVPSEGLSAILDYSLRCP